MDYSALQGTPRKGWVRWDAGWGERSTHLLLAAQVGRLTCSRARIFPGACSHLDPDASWLVAVLQVCEGSCGVGRVSWPHPQAGKVRTFQDPAWRKGFSLQTTPWWVSSLLEPNPLHVAEQGGFHVELPGGWDGAVQPAAQQEEGLAPYSKTPKAEWCRGSQPSSAGAWCANPSCCLAKFNNCPTLI